MNRSSDIPFSRSANRVRSGAPGTEPDAYPAAGLPPDTDPETFAGPHTETSSSRGSAGPTGTGGADSSSTHPANSSGPGRAGAAGSGGAADSAGSRPGASSTQHAGDPSGPHHGSPSGPGRAGAADAGAAGSSPGASSTQRPGDPSGPHHGFPAPSGSVFHADPTLADGTWEAALPEGFTGRLSCRGTESLGYDETVSALHRLGMLISWAQAQQARVAARLEVLFARDIAEASGREEPALALSLAAAEASAVLNIPHMTAMQLISESSRLCADAPETLAQLAEGKIALQHARIILEETYNLPAEVLNGEASAVDAGGTGTGTGTDVKGQAPTNAAGNPSAEDSGQLDLGLDGQDGQSGKEETCPGSPHDAPAGRDGADASADSHAPAEAELLTVRAAFERDLLAAAEGKTAAGFGRRARRLRESRFPDLIPVRHRQAKDKRRVTFQPLPDGMSCLSAIIAAEKGQAMFSALTSAAKAGKRAGDPRTTDQLRADILTALLLTEEPAAENTTGAGTQSGAGSNTGDETDSDSRTGTGTMPRTEPSPGQASRTDTRSGPNPASYWGFGPRPGSDLGSGPHPGPGSRSGSDSDSDSDQAFRKAPHPGPNPASYWGFSPSPSSGLGSDLHPGPGFDSDSGSGSGSGPDADSGSRSGSPNPTNSPASPRRSPRQETKRPRRAERYRNQNPNRSKIRTEVMVLINADTLAGLDENPAELNGYGPISAETARTMILEALHWTPLLQDPATGEILSVGRTRRIPSGLKRWLQARDGTCRFPGCSVSVTHAEIDHTTPFSHGGPTDHANLEHLCPKHHRFKTLGHWKARQPEAGTIEWNSPTGRTYTTGPALDYTPIGAGQSRRDQAKKKPQDDDPPPF